MAMKLPAVVLAASMIFISLVSGVQVLNAKDTKAKAVFAVHCYDVGKAALEDMDGVISVERGWRGLNEINTVIYDPEKITVEEMEDALKRANTYKETISTE